MELLGQPSVPSTETVNGDVEVVAVASRALSYRFKPLESASVLLLKPMECESCDSKCVFALLLGATACRD